MDEHGLALIAVGLLVVLSLAAKAIGNRWRLPAPLLLLTAGMLLSIGVTALPEIGRPLTTGSSMETMRFLADIGLVALLFRIGLESRLADMLAQLPRALILWVGNLAGSLLLVYLAAVWLLDYDTKTAGILTLALSATSVGVPAAIWCASGQLRRRVGQLFVDTAELDDISGILAIGVLLALLPQWADNGLEGIELLRPAGSAVITLLAFGLVMLLFARYLCPPTLRWIRRFENGPDPMLSVIGLGLVFAAVAAMAGLSLAIGAFLAGLTFSSDRQAVRQDLAFDTIYDLFTPFFFLVIGLQFDITALGPQVAIAVPVLTVAAVLGKVIGTSGPALAFVDRRQALALGVSMVPRAEVALIIGDRVHNQQTDLLPDSVYGVLLLVCLLTSLLCAGVLPHLIGARKEAERTPAKRPE